MLVAFVALTACRISPTKDAPTGSLPRSFEARLSEEVAFSPCGSPSDARDSLRPVHCSPSPGEDFPRALPSWRELRSESPETDRLASVVRLLALAPTEENLRNALEVLRSTGEPGSGAQATALGAVYHALAQVSGDPALLVDALEQTSRALELAPSSDAARFNRALIESDLGLCRRAHESWTESLASTSAHWADEVRSRQTALPCGDSHPPQDMPDVLFETAVGDLLPQWAAARLRDAGEARRLLDRIAAHGERLWQEARDPWLRSLARQLRRADRRQASAVRDYARGRVLFNDAEYREATPYLLRARAQLPEDSVLIPWCDLWLAGIRLNEGDFAGAEILLESHRQAPEVNQSPLLVGRIAWARGLGASRAGRLETAHDRYVEAKRSLERGGYRLSAAWVATLEAEALTELGFVNESWRARIRALNDLQAHEDHPALHNGLLGGAQAATATGRYRAAHALASEAAALTDENDPFPGTTEALLTRGDIFLAQGGERVRALEAYRRALEATRAVADPVTRGRLAVRARLGLWDASGGTSGRPLAELDRVIRYFSERGPAWREIQALRVKTRTLALGGDPSAADAVIEEAIGRIREVQGQIGDEPLGFRHWESLQEVFDEAIDLALTSGRPETALALLEEARRPTGGPRQALPVRECVRADVRAEAPPRGQDRSPVTVVFGATGAHLAWWRIDRNHCTFGFARQEAVQAEVADLVERFASRTIEPDQLKDLYRELLAEPLHGVAPSRPLILVPDRHLLRLPFAALRNPETERYLVEERALSFRLGLLDDRPEDPPQLSPNPARWRIVVVGDPAFDRRALPWLPRLPGAAREAQRIASLYPSRATLLAGAQATAARIEAEAKRSQVLHLAAHAVPGADGSRDVLVLANDPQKGSSGLVASQELVGAGSPALELVVLSACSTLGTTPSRSGGLAGLARPFVAQGASAVVGTLWPLDDRVLTPIMIRFHEGLLAGLSASESLQRAQVAALTSESSTECCDWAGIQLVGEIEPDGGPR